MTLTFSKFTPEVMLSAPRRSAAQPNPSGTKVLYTVSTYSFVDHKKTLQIKVLDIHSGQSSVVVEDPSLSEPLWLGDSEFVYLKAIDKGRTKLLLDDISSKYRAEPRTIHVFDGGISALKIKKLSDGTFALACAALATPAGHLANPETEKKPHSSAKVYDSLFVRHWDTWETHRHNSIWYGTLKKSGGSSDGEGDGDGNGYVLGESGLVNALKGTQLSSPVAPFGGTGDFDISESGLVFVAKDPALNPAVYTKTDLYYVPLKSFNESKPPPPKLVPTPGLEGYSGSPVFSHDGKRVAFTRMRSRQYESDKTRLMLVSNIDGDLDAPGNVREFYATVDDQGGWDARPDSIAWSRDDKRLFVTAEASGRACLWTLLSDPDAASSNLPKLVDTGNGSVVDFRLLARAKADSTKFFISSSSLIDNSCYGTIDPASEESYTYELVSSNSKCGKTFGLSQDQCGDIWLEGAGDYPIHALVMKPSDFDSSKKYPLAFLIHGGPQGAWVDGWSTRWNPAVFAEQGYVVVAPNPTGSTGYGMAFQDGIRGQWGGRPYEDLVKVVDYIQQEMPFVDMDRAVAMGASYGGYMINWIQGHPLGRRFKALVCHDGVFSTLNQWGTEELFFPIHDFEGTLWENREGYAKWDPAQFVGEWATPQLVIHSELDYRLPIPEGLAPFNVLQAKGIPSRFLMFPDENHWVLKPENSLVWHKEVLGFINKYAGLDDS